MGYVKPPEPADDVVIFEATGTTPAFTWGDHRHMLRLLQDAEAGDEAVAAASSRLDAKLKELGYKEPELICEFCWRKESEPHDRDCPDNNDPSLWVQREALAYQYLGPDFVPVHVTSVPMNDDEALEYFGIVELMFVGPGPHARYIQRKALDSQKFEMMPWYFDNDKWEVRPIERPGT